jgi:acyl dehydratase
MPEARTLYAEDLLVGEQIDLGNHHVTETEILTFAGQWDPLPIHTDPVAAASGRFGGLIGSGIHSMAIAQRLAVEGLFKRVAVVAGRRVRAMNMIRPLRPNTTVRATLLIVTMDLSRRHTAEMTARSTLFDDGGELLTVEIDSIIERAPWSGVNR